MKKTKKMKANKKKFMKKNMMIPITITKKMMKTVKFLSNLEIKLKTF